MTDQHNFQTVALGLGGNLGDPPSTMASALQILDSHASIAVRQVSPLYRTPPWGKTDQAWFYNCCALVDTTLDPKPMLDACLATEQKLKRVRRERWGPRVIDIDVLTYGSRKVDQEGLTIPHPHMFERAFVLVPLADIAGDLMVSKRTVSDWLELCDTGGIEPASADGNWWR